MKMPPKKAVEGIATSTVAKGFISTTHRTDQLSQGAVSKAAKPTKKEVVKKTKAKADSTTAPETLTTTKRTTRAVKEPENKLNQQRTTRAKKIINELPYLEKAATTAAAPELKTKKEAKQLEEVDKLPQLEKAAATASAPKLRAKREVKQLEMANEKTVIIEQPASITAVSKPKTKKNLKALEKTEDVKKPEVKKAASKPQSKKVEKLQSKAEDAKEPTVKKAATKSTARSKVQKAPKLKTKTGEIQDVQDVNAENIVDTLKPRARREAKAFANTKKIKVAEMEAEFPLEDEEDEEEVFESTPDLDDNQPQTEGESGDESPRF